MARSIIPIRILLLLLLTALVLEGCKLPVAGTPAPTLKLPDTYNGNSDSSNSGSSPVKLFYPSTALHQLIDTILQNNFDLQIALQRIEMAGAAVTQSKGALLPQVSAVGSPAIRRFGLYTMDGAGNIVTDIEKGKLVPKNLPDFYGGFQASWEIDIWGKLKNRKKASLSRWLSTQAGREAIITGLVAETAGSYYELMAEDQMLKVINEAIALQEMALETVRIQKQTAQVNELAVQQFEAQLLAWKAMRYEVLRAIDRLENKIYGLAGKLPFPITRDSSILTAAVIPTVRVGLPSALLRNRPDIREAELDLLASHADLRAARAAFLPNFTITGGVGAQAYRTGLLFVFPEALAYSLVGSLAGPVFNRNSIKAEFARSNAMQREALLRYERLITQGYLEVSLGLKNIEKLEEIYGLKEKESNYLRSSINVSADLFRTGRASYLEVLIARQNALRANMELINARKEQLLNVVGLYRALGGGR